MIASRRIYASAIIPVTLSCLHRLKSGQTTCIPEFEEDNLKRVEVEVDSLVIGGGICGVSTALYLAKMGRKVMIVEREEIGGPFQASSVNSGIIETFFDFNLLQQQRRQCEPDPEECIKSYLLHKMSSSSSTSLSSTSSAPSLSDL